MANLDETQRDEVLFRPKAPECISCRLIGTGALAGTGAYAIWLSRAAAPGSPGQRRVLAGLGIGKMFCVLSN